MKRILAIAMLAVRSAVRSRVVVVLLALLLLAIVGLPLTVRGDGTLEGQIQILLRYTLGAASVILSIATVWAGCAAVSLEIQDKQIHLVLTKPVSRAEVWLGKWIGLTLLNAVLLAVAALTVYGLLRWSTRPGQLTDAQETTLRGEILVARRQVLPVPIDVEADARRIVLERQEAGDLPPGVPVDQVFQMVRQMLLNQAYAVPTGYKRQWVFRLPGRPAPDRPLLFRYQFQSSQTKDALVAGVWLVGTPAQPAQLELPQASVAGGHHTFSVPPTVVGEDGTLLVEYANVNREPLTVLFGPADGLQLMVYQGRFETNLVRAVLLILAQLAFLGALGVTAGALLSLPVAALTSAYLVLLIKVSGFMETVAESTTGLLGRAGPGVNAPATRAAESFLNWVLQAEAALVRPLASPVDPVELLATGGLVSWETVGWAWLTQVLLYGGILLLAGTWLFNRREIALPS
ncbi:hypothetical protein HQ590_07935 [bacterium]|nr:hypothetical protein [bacterium]